MEQDMGKMLDDLFGEEQEVSFGTLLRKSIEKYEDGGKNAGVTEIDPDLRKIYDGMPDHSKQLLFRNDIRTAQRIIGSTAALLPENKKLFVSSKKLRLERAWGLLAGVFGRAMIMLPGRILESISADSRYDDIPRETLTACIAECLGFICSLNTDLRDRTDLWLLRERMVSQSAVQNRGAEDRFIHDPEYGLVPEKPVFVRGFGADRAYLDALRTAGGVRMTYDRLGSTQVPGISGPVDIYDLFLPGGKKYMRIYVCLYGEKNSRTAPRGLKFAG